MAHGSGSYPRGPSHAPDAGSTTRERVGNLRLCQGYNNLLYWLSSKIATLPLSLSWHGWQGWQAVAMSPPPVLLTRKKGTACALDFAPGHHRWSHTMCRF